MTISDIQMELKNLFSEEKLKNLLMRVKEVSRKAGLRLNIKKN